MKFVFFRFAVLIILLLLLWFEYRIFRQWKKYLKSRPWFRYLVVIYWAFVISIQLPLLIWIIKGSSNWLPPVEGLFAFFYYIFISWNYSLFLYLPFYLAASFLATAAFFIYGKIFRKIGSAENSPVTEDTPKGGICRRDFLQMGLDAVPFLLSSFTFIGIAANHMAPQVKRVQLQLRGLHQDLLGFTIIHISDLHIGHLIHNKYLDQALCRIRDIQADVLVVTGDIIDTSNTYLPVAGRFFASIIEKLKFGGFAVTGNHDRIDNVAQLSQGLTFPGFRFLRNQSHLLRRGKGELNLAGLDYPPLMSRAAGNRIRLSRKYFEKVKTGLKNDLPLILLNHHPMDFLYLQYENVDLVLSGHTHGGQVAWNPPQMDPKSSGSSNSWLDYIFEFNRGLYERNGSALYVNSGLGHWFPMRINCPPEITLIELC